jgi:hypothetical protein
MWPGGLLLVSGDEQDAAADEADEGYRAGEAMHVREHGVAQPALKLAAD